MSLQIAILKVLVSYPDGRATIAELNSDLSILNTSGRDWTDRLKRLAAHAPDLSIFSQRFVFRDNAGWQITEAGRAFLIALETGARLASRDERSPEVVPSTLQQPPLLLVGIKRRQRKARRGRTNPRRRSA